MTGVIRTRTVRGTYEHLLRYRAEDGPRHGVGASPFSQQPPGRQPTWCNAGNRRRLVSSDTGGVDGGNCVARISALCKTLIGTGWLFAWIPRLTLPVSCISLLHKSLAQVSCTEEPAQRSLHRACTEELAQSLHRACTDRPADYWKTHGSKSMASSNSLFILAALLELESCCIGFWSAKALASFLFISSSVSPAIISTFE